MHATLEPSIVRPAPQTVTLTGGGVDLLTREVRVGGRADRLTLREAELLGFLARRPGSTVTRDELLAQVFGYRVQTSRAVDTAISRLRAKIELDPDRPVHVISIYGEGYRFEAAADGAAVPVERLGVPVERTPLIGRASEVAAIRALVRDDAHRTVVLVGPGGVGKTRLAARIAAEADADRVVFVPLAQAASVPDVVALVGRAIGAPTDGARSVDAATAVVGLSLDTRRSTLLVLDSVEHVDGIADLVRSWLEAAPSLRILAASRTAIAGAHVVRVDCLAPESAATLYVERATAAGGSVGPADLDAVRLLVASLDHLPLAVELAAARARTLTPVQMRGRLDARLQLLSGGPRDGEPRLASLRATLDWSWELLGPDDREALARLSVFPARITAAAAAWVLGPDAGAAIARLGSASLVQETEDGTLLLATVRVWAGEKALALGVRAASELAHAVGHVAWLGEVQPLPAVRASLDRVEAELAHLLVVPSRMERIRPDLAVDTVLGLWELFQIRGPIEPYVAALECGLRAARDAGDPRLPRVLRARAMSLRLLGRAVEAEADLREARGATTDPYLRAWLGSELAVVLGDNGRFEESAALFAEVIPTLEGINLASSRAAYAALRTLRGDHGPETEEMLRCSLVEAEAGGWLRISAAVLSNLGVLLANGDRSTEAEEVLVRAIADLRELGALRRLPSALMALGAVRVGQGRIDEADALTADAEALARLTGNRRWVGLAITNRASLQLVLGDSEEGLRRLDEAEAVLASVEDRWGWYLLDVYRSVLLAASDRSSEAQATAQRAEQQLGELGAAVGREFLNAMRGHLAWAEVREARAAGRDPGPARERVRATVASATKGTGARFLVSILPADGG